jgi:RhtB (resistance to homoserine/threonine) family protein
MEHLAMILGTIAIYWLVMVSPGPNFVLITHTSMVASRVHGLAAAWGITIGGAIWIVAALAGISVLLQAFPLAANVIQTLGGLYLIHLGIRNWRNAKIALAERRVVIRNSVGSTLAQGILTNLSNPKTVAFYSSIFAVFATPSAPTWVKVAIVGGIISSAFVWYSAMALFFSTAHAKRIYNRAKAPIDRVCGVIMGGLGIRLLTSRI